MAAACPTGYPVALKATGLRLTKTEVGHGHTFRYTVAFGADAGPDLRSEVVQVIDSLEISRHGVSTPRA